MNRLERFEEVLHPVGEGVVGEILVGEQGIAAIGRQFKRVEHGDKNVDGTYKIDNKYHLHYCGYVGMPKMHPLYGKVNDFGGTSWIEEDGIERDDMLYVHGGITFTGYKRPWGTQFFFVGFDTAHYNDINDVEILEDLITAALNDARNRIEEKMKEEMIKVEKKEMEKEMEKTAEKEEGNEEIFY